jgi:hypothetical protein
LYVNQKDEKTPKRINHNLGNFTNILKGRVITSGVNLTNILRASFSYESFAQSFFVLEVKVKLFIGTKKMAQMRS